MSDLEDFKAQHGERWSQLIEEPAFRAALQLGNVQKINSISALSDEHIEKHAREILGDIRGHLRLENFLVSVHEQEEFKMPTDTEEEYISPEQEAQMQELIEKFKKNKGK